MAGDQGGESDGDCGPQGLDQAIPERFGRVLAKERNASRCCEQAESWAHGLPLQSIARLRWVVSRLLRSVVRVHGYGDKTTTKRPLLPAQADSRLSDSQPVGFLATTGEPVAVRGMAGRERRNGLTVEKRSPGKYEVMRVQDGKPTQRTMLQVPAVLGDQDNIPDPIIVDDEVGWSGRTFDSYGYGWFFSKLTAQGLSPHLVVGRMGGCCNVCCSDRQWSLFGGFSLLSAFYKDGRWSTAQLVGAGLLGAGPALLNHTCRHDVAYLVLADHGVRGKDAFDVEEVGCTQVGCVSTEAYWPGPKPDLLVMAVNLADEDGRGQTVFAWQDKAGALYLKIAPIAELATSETRVHATNRRFAEPGDRATEASKLMVRDGVALLAFEDTALRLLRIDVKGNVGPVVVEGD